MSRIEQTVGCRVALRDCWLYARRQQDRKYAANPREAKENDVADGRAHLRTLLFPALLAAAALAAPEARQARVGAPAFAPGNPAGAAIEQTSPGSRSPAELVASFDGLGVGFEGPQGPSTGGNPSDNSIAVGPDHIMQTVNSRLAIFSKKGKKYDKTGTVLYWCRSQQHGVQRLRWNV